MAKYILTTFNNQFAEVECDRFEHAEGCIIGYKDSDEEHEAETVVFIVAAATSAIVLKE